MKQYYSHLNGLEYLLVHRPKLWEEIVNAINKINAEEAFDKISKEKMKKGKILYSPAKLNQLFKIEF